ncbi:hypothetical protein P691DRAFT_811937 [Macrolepiota fuliginosa MF-IS2]|uniref:Uncharacterized protein n=1 Tax=Macrolepiota fuliginosa MF-IS2 TaxID=1400762 RepID=A0A9P6C5G1_9AGAR|nr:hypothetical protein P691DRAFT_811937 [Macrolepiota fuliginosa MF-IS2]
MVLPLHEEIPVVFAGALAFGLYFSTFLSCGRWLLFEDGGWKARRDIKWLTVIIAVLIFGCNVTFLAWNLRWTMVKALHMVNDPDIVYQMPEWADIVSCTVENSNVLLADITVIYRCWIVYGQSASVIMVPIFLWFAAFLCNVLQIYLRAAHITSPIIGPYSPGVVLMPFWISTILLNAYVSVGLIRRIYQTAKKCKFFMSIEHLHFVIQIISESGVLYFSITLAHFLSWFGKSTFSTTIISVLNAPVVGIAFNWFVIRVAMNKVENAKEDSYDQQSGSAIKFNTPFSSEVSDDTACAGTADIIFPKGNEGR